MLDLKNLSTAGRQRRCGAELSTRALRMRLLRLLGYSLRGRRVLYADRRCCAELSVSDLRLLSACALRLGYSLRDLRILCADRRSSAELSARVLRLLSTRALRLLACSQRLRLLGLLSMYDRRSGAELSPHAHAAGWGIKSTDGGPDECGRCSTR